ncbi:MAG: hypothetical protein NUW37_20210 [Planctomycetes bacterium]|nr:hypothetical protein [Planctomycetota bacterium]
MLHLFEIQRVITLDRILVIVFALLAVLGLLTLTGHVPRRTALLAVLSWFVPGAGHVILKEKTRGVIFFSVINFFLVMGLVITKNNPIDMLNHEYYALLEIFHGIGFVIGAFAGSTFDVSLHPVTQYELGMLYVIVASLLNLLAIMHLLSRKETAPAEAK